MHEQPTAPAQPPPPGPAGERRAPTAVWVLIGLLVAAVGGLGAAVLIFAVGEEKPKTVTATQKSVVTRTETTTTSTETTPTGPTIDQPTAKQAAQDAASATVEDFGISIPASDFDARCTAQGGGSEAEVWTCEVTSSSGQCSGTITVFAKSGGATGTRDNQIGCGE